MKIQTASMLYALASLLNLTIAACEKKSGDGGTAAATAAAPLAAPAAAASEAKKASCNQRKRYDTCIDFSDRQIAKGEAFLKGTCTQPGDVFSFAPCPAENVLGTCTGADKGGSVTRYYSGGKEAYTNATAKKHCTEIIEGKWQ